MCLSDGWVKCTYGSGIVENWFVQDFNDLCPDGRSSKRVCVRNQINQLLIFFWLLQESKSHNEWQHRYTNDSQHNIVAVISKFKKEEAEFEHPWEKKAKRKTRFHYFWSSWIKAEWRVTSRYSASLEWMNHCTLRRDWMRWFLKETVIVELWGVSPYNSVWSLHRSVLLAKVSVFSPEPAESLRFPQLRQKRHRR